MNALINRIQQFENPNPSFRIEGLDFTDCGKINLGKCARAEYSKQAILIAAILVSQPNKFCAAPMNLNENSQIEFRQGQIPLSTVLPRFDSSLFYVVNTSKTELEAEFNSLVRQWREETFSYSSLTKAFSHPAYVRIMAMGKDGLEYVLRELKTSNDSWFYALKFMAGKDGEGVAEGVKDSETAKSAWLEWGYKNNYI